MNDGVELASVLAVFDVIDAAVLEDVAEEDNRAVVDASKSILSDKVKTALFNPLTDELNSASDCAEFIPIDVIANDVEEASALT